MGLTSQVGLPLPLVEAGQVVPVHFGRQTHIPPPIVSLPASSPAGQPPLGLPAEGRRDIGRGRGAWGAEGGGCGGCSPYGPAASNTPTKLSFAAGTWT
eukprot:SAG31_NODE_2722_length_5188_cov_6.223030_2_plen_98_part_00